VAYTTSRTELFVNLCFAPGLSTDLSGRACPPSSSPIPSPGLSSEPAKSQSHSVPLSAYSWMILAEWKVTDLGEVDVVEGVIVEEVVDPAHTAGEPGHELCHDVGSSSRMLLSTSGLPC
jgi:hypothetical protein